MHANSSNRRALAGPFVFADSVKTPVAATGVAALLEYGYDLVNWQPGSLKYRDGRPREDCLMAAVKLVLRNPPARDAAPLWKHPDADRFYEWLHVYPQLWVHVDFDGYRRAWIDLKMETDWHQMLDRGTYLDHVQNRDAARLRNSIYPYIRLMPVPHGVNSSAGNKAGGERMECNMIKVQGVRQSAKTLVFADPFDLTKMLRLAPGTQQLAGASAFHDNFYIP